MLVGFKAQNHPQQHRHKPANDVVDDRALPPSDFALLHQRFGFSIDVAASPANAKLPRYCTAQDSGLKASWTWERVYCNPPFSDIRPWVIKAWESTNCPLSVLLLPANRTEQGWWQDLIEPLRDRPGSPLRVEFLRDRIRFIKRGKTIVGPNERPPFGCCLCIWERPLPPAMHPKELNPLGLT